MVLKRIMTKNIQNHREVVIDLPPAGLIVFTGDNSNGKSVIVKVTKALATNTIKKPRKRASLVNRHASFGEVTYTRDDDVQLILHLTREAATTYVSYIEPGAEPITRYLADKTYTDLVRRFGWHYSDEAGLTLNIAEQDEALLFYKTSYKTNDEILRTATADTVANKVVENLQNTLKEARTFRDNQVTTVRGIQVADSELRFYDAPVLEDLKGKLEYYHKILTTVYFPKLPVVEAVPDVRFTDVYIPVLTEIPYPRVVAISCDIPNLTELAKELETLRNHKCPTCGRSFETEVPHDC